MILGVVGGIVLGGTLTKSRLYYSIFWPVKTVGKTPKNSPKGAFDGLFRPLENDNGEREKPVVKRVGAMASSGQSRPSMACEVLVNLLDAIVEPYSELRLVASVG